MKTRTRLALSAIATIVLSVHFWMLARTRPAATPPASNPKPAAALDLLSTPGSTGPSPPVVQPAAQLELPAPPAAPAASALPASRTTQAVKVNAKLDPRAGGAVTTAAVEPPAAPEAASAPAAPAAASAAEPEPAAPPPVYRTRMPPAATISYRLSRGGVSGSGSLVWRPEAQGYSLRLEGKVPIVGTLITQNSRGSLEAAGLAPLRFTDKRLRRSEQAANFQRAGDGSGEVTFSGSTNAVPLHRGTQDRLSVMVQLAAIAEAWGRPPAVGDHVLVHVVGARGDEAHWSLRYEGTEGIRTEGGETVQALKFLRESDSPHGTRAEFWLHPGHHHLPLKARLSDGNSEPFELLWQSAE
ncbi:DUF3108 domain-containing protein [Rivibacter subsaxonicus]|uniref:Uncharacterized protein DUF3108 n=1 Tax=Rivibacter subsaxonicus TaxID=457575 RepID=A0A4Q7VWI5_9BURK|nr:DUF3108 domain-containing protein [Rivibacter subsaxonicus]RZU01102.1 uncharacterized protein DUF3108 [Rivibacter subsaxonicus]